MAEWRNRGYVADSDEEDDTQLSNPQEQSILENGSCDIDDIEQNEGDKVRSNEQCMPSNGSGVLESHSRTDHAGERLKKLAEKNTQASANFANYPTRFVAVAIENKNRSQIHRQTLNIDMIDELQQDHYEQGPPARLGAGSSLDPGIPSRTPTVPCPQTPSTTRPHAWLEFLGGSESSSPLSEVPSSLNFTPSSDPIRRSLTNVNDMGRSPLIKNTSTDTAVISNDCDRRHESVNPSHDTNQASRTLRHRNPIQLHPYAIEGEKYRQTLKARGLRPLRIHQTQEDTQNIGVQNPSEGDFDVDEESQVVNDNSNPGTLISSSPFHDGDEPGSSSPLRASNMHASSSPSGSLFLRLEDDLPDIGLILQNHPSHMKVQGSKRRKTFHSPSKRNGTIKEATRRPDMTSNTSQPDIRTQITEDPPSPPHSGPSSPPYSNQVLNALFRRPRGISPSVLPTPLTSSEPRKIPVTNITEDADFSINSNTEASSGEEQLSTKSSGFASDDAINHQLERAQRKIRGVLPASWLKLDLMTQRKKVVSSARAYRCVSPDISREHRGVARVKIPREGLERPLGIPAPIILSDDEDSISRSDLGEFDNPRSSEQPSQGNFEPNEFHDTGHFPSAYIGEVEEDNRIDQMLPSAERAKPYSKRRRKSQLKRANRQIKRSTFIDLDIVRKSQAVSTHQPRITDRFSKTQRKKPVFRPPRLSILDAPRQERGLAEAHFLKIASRTARLRMDRGRHSPTRKCIRLAMSSDTMDAHNTLRAWREGTIAPNRSILNPPGSKVSSRQPLHPRSSNNRLPSNPASFLQKARENQNPSLHAALAKKKSPSATKSLVQTSLDQAIRRQSSNTGNTHYGNRNIKKRNIITLGRKHRLKPLQSTSDARPANLESHQIEDDRNKTKAAFQRHLSDACQSSDLQTNADILLKRFFEEDADSASIDVSPQSILRNEEKTSRPAVRQLQAKPKGKCRKRLPRHVNIDAPKFRQIVSPAAENSPQDPRTPMVDQHGIRIMGLLSLGVQHTQTLNISPLPSGIFFHSSTFIGSGMFFKSLQTGNPEKMDKARGFILIKVDEDTFKWSSWNDTVSTQLGTAFCKISAGLQAFLTKNDAVAFHQSALLLTNIICYVSDHLNFSDTVDRVSYLQRCRSLVKNLLIELDSSLSSPDELQRDFWLPFRTLTLVIIHQLRLISRHELVSSEVQAEILSLLIRTAREHLQITLTEGFQYFPDCLENFRHLENCEHGIQTNHSSIEAVVVAHHILRQNVDSLVAFWDIARDTIICTPTDGIVNIEALEESWQKLFTILPFLEFDTQGLIKTGQRFKFSNDDWHTVKELINCVFDSYLKIPKKQASMMNNYCRTLLARCLHLINSWGWRRCQPIIGTIFDFFARNNLGHLIDEESHGSPKFLEHLDEGVRLEAETEDRSFHLFLKILGNGLHHLRKINSDKRIRDLVWRLMPNHGRLYPKEEAIHQRELDALRNHHDLLCTLYWASPSFARPGLNVIRNLVHLESSHREACHINIRAWLNLIRFQLSASDEVSSLDPFVDWYNDLLRQVLGQYSQARTEAEEHVRRVEQAGYSVSKPQLEVTIARNQRQVTAIIDDILVSLNIAMDASVNLECATSLLTPALASAFKLFDVGGSQSHKIIIQTLGILLTFNSKCLPKKCSANGAPVNDDSQDYGDWSALADDIMDADKSVPLTSERLPAAHLLKEFHDPLKDLLSSCFGADTAPEDTLLLKVTEVWFGIAHVVVHHGIKTWGDYITPFGHDSWNRLRRTEQTRKFTGYYFSLVIENDTCVYQEHRTFLLSSWIESLLERESMIKFQHRFTAALLNANYGEPLLNNLPFWKSTELGRYDITPFEFLERRLSIISTVLSNIRELSEVAMYRSDNPSIPGQVYKNLLKHIMSTMKKNYQELGQGSNTSGVYVEFIHRVVESLQQHTSEICPVDRFFTDSVAFPLPVADPTYLVGRLKSYGLRLQDSRTPKQLCIFIQSVSERAALDGQQDHFVSQLQAALINKENATLQSFVIQAIVPAYLDVAFDTSSGWLLALPILRALQAVFCGLLMSLDGANPASVAAVVAILVAFLHSARTSVASLVDRPAWPKKLSTLRLLGVLYSDIIALLPILDYIVRLPQPTQYAFQCIEFFKGFAEFSSAYFSPDQPDGCAPTMPSTRAIPTPKSAYTEIRAFTLRELRDALDKHWATHDERHYVTRSNVRREISVDMCSFDEAKRDFLQDLEDFWECLASLPTFGNG